MAYYFMVETKKGIHRPIEISKSKYFPNNTRKYKKDFAYALQEIDNFTMMFNDEIELRERLCEEGTLPFHLFEKPLSIRFLNKKEYNKVPYELLYQEDIEYIIEPTRLIEKIIRSFYEGDLLLIKKIASRFSEEYKCKTTAMEIRHHIDASIRENRLSRHFDELDENNDKLLPRLLKLIVLENTTSKYGKVIYKNTPNYRNLHILIALVKHHENSKIKEDPIKEVEPTNKKEEIKKEENKEVKKLTLGISGTGKKKYILDDQLKFDI